MYFNFKRCPDLQFLHSCTVTAVIKNCTMHKKFYVDIVENQFMHNLNTTNIPEHNFSSRLKLINKMALLKNIQVCLCVVKVFHKIIISLESPHKTQNPNIGVCLFCRFVQLYCSCTVLSVTCIVLNSKEKPKLKIYYTEPYTVKMVTFIHQFNLCQNY